MTTPLTMTGTKVAWFPGDDEYDATNPTGEFDRPGWVAFAVLNDGGLSYPIGYGQPRLTSDEAEADRPFIAWDNGAEFRKPTS